MIYWVCPFSKPQFRSIVLNNFNHQTYQNKHLIIVENGQGTGCFQNGDSMTVLQSPKHQSLAKNIGLAHLRSIKAEYWSTMDCDDYYGPDYLNEMALNRDKAPIIGKIKYYVRTEDRSLYLFNKAIDPGFVIGVWGATIGCRVDKSPDFDVVRVGEEELWMRKFRLFRGIYNTGPGNFVHLRWHKDHITNKMDKNQFIFGQNNMIKISNLNIPENLKPYQNEIYSGASS